MNAPGLWIGAGLRAWIAQSTSFLLERGRRLVSAHAARSTWPQGLENHHLSSIIPRISISGEK
jgi:hypothetical protein